MTASVGNPDALCVRGIRDSNQLMLSNMGADSDYEKEGERKREISPALNRVPVGNAPVRRIEIHRNFAGGGTTP